MREVVNFANDGGYVHFANNVGSSTLTNDQGLAFGWNKSNGGGESIIIGNQGGGNAGGLVFATNTSGGSYAERMRINSTGQVGIGGTPARKLSILDDVDGYTLELEQTSAYGNARQSGIVFSAIYHNAGSVTDMASIRGGRENGTHNNYAGKLGFFTRSNGGSDTERMRIASNGDIHLKSVGAQPSASVVGWEYHDTGGNYPWVKQSVGGTGNLTQYQFYNPNGAVGQIYTGGSSTTYSTSSDYRLKENVDYTWDATTLLKQLKPCKFNFIKEQEGEKPILQGFLAHEVSDIVPGAVRYTKDAVDSEGEPEYQALDHSKLVPLLVKTIQELEARITTLEG